MDILKILKKCLYRELWTKECKMNYGKLREKILDSINVVLNDELKHLEKLREKGKISLV